MANHSTTLNVITFPGAPNLPVFAAIEHGFFEAENISLAFSTTVSSVQQMEKFAAGAVDIAFTAFDNIVAYREGQGAVKFDTPPDFEAVYGATQIELSLIAAPEIKSVQDLRGKTCALDAVSTGFAFVCYHMLEQLGLPQGTYEAVAVGATPERWLSVKEGKHAATITIEPFTSIAIAAGFTKLSLSSSFFPSYQGGVVAARRTWMAQHADELRRFLRAYQRGLEWTLNPANRENAAKLLLANMPEIKLGVIAPVMESLLSQRSGLTPDGALLLDGMEAVLALRSRYGKPQKTLNNVEAYLNRSFIGNL